MSLEIPAGLADAPLLSSNRELIDQILPKARFVCFVQVISYVLRRPLPVLAPVVVESWPRLPAELQSHFSSLEASVCTARASMTPSIQRFIVIIQI
jgi:hypothetical protein